MTVYSVFEGQEEIMSFKGTLLLDFFDVMATDRTIVSTFQ
jgi:hypothetical protein